MNRISDSLRVLLWSSVFIYVVISALQITQVDIWWQLAEGAHILRTGHLPTEPAAAFGLPAQPYFDEYAGYEVVLATLYQLAGFPGLWVAFIAVYLTILFLPSLYSRRMSALYDVASCLALLTAGILMKDRLEQRPELVGSFLQVLLMVWLRASKLEEWTARSALLLFLIFVAWTNTHSSFLFGLFTLGLWLACEIALKYRTVPVPVLLTNGFRLTMVASLALVLNPYGAERLAFPFRQALDPGSTALSPEMWPILAITSVQGISWLVAVVLLTWALITSRTTPLWMILFSTFAAYMTYKSFRCVSLLAIALLFVYAARDVTLKPGTSRFLVLGLLRCTALAFLCVFLIFGDAFTLVASFNEARTERHFATHANQFAPELVDDDVFTPGHRLPVICEHGQGSYLSFDANTRFSPILDSGMGHFSDEAKRYFFFIAHEPEAFGQALASLKVNYVIMNYNSFHWILKTEQCPGWKMIACSFHGMIWQRVPGAGPYAPNEADRAAIASARDGLRQQDDLRSAFVYSTLLGHPADSLAIFSTYRNTEWPEAFFNFFCDWVNALPTEVIQDFLAHRDAGNNLVMDAVLHERLGPDSFAEFAKNAAPKTAPFFFKVVEARTFLAQGDKGQARTIFDSLPTEQPSCVAYYKLFHEVRIMNPTHHEVSAYGQWQTWDESAKDFMAATAAPLNRRIDELNARDLH